MGQHDCPASWFWRRASNPEGLMLQDEHRTYSGAELFNAVAGLSRLLLDRGVQSQQRIGVLCGKTASQVIAQLSIWSVGAVYVPISLKNPQARVDYILDDCSVDVVVVEDQSIFEQYLFPGRTVVEVKAAVPGADAKGLVAPRPEDISYIIYTSGTTGKPKGVTIQNHSLVRLIRTAEETFTEQNGDNRFLQVVDFSFDVSIWDVILWLVKGGSLITGEIGQNVYAFLSLIEEYKPTYICAAAPTYSLLMNVRDAWQDQDFSFIRSIITTASYCPPKIALQLAQDFPAAKLYNCYGPTETTVYCCWTEITKDSIDLLKPLSIGYPLPGLKAHLYDGETLHDATDIPEGVEMELGISGDQVFKGYWGAPELTEQKLLYSAANERVYRTGDLVTRKGEQFHYFGRSDDTIKIAGYRVNLGEIELCIGSSESVGNCAVLDVVNEDALPSLVAFYSQKAGVAEAAAQNLRSELIARCRAQLPAYMIPRQFVLVPEFPVNTSGKIDKRKLREHFQPL